jgi:predicted kinase
MSTIYFMIGVPGSGKSTIAKKLVKAIDGAHYVCPDEIRLHLTGNVSNFSKDNAVWTIVHQKLVHAIRVRKVCVFDATGANYYLRKKMIAFLKEHDSDPWIQGVYIRVPLSAAIRQNFERADAGGPFVPPWVITVMFNQLAEHPPSLMDGFSNIMEIKND